MKIEAQERSRTDGKEYRIVNDLPAWGYYSIERCDVYASGACAWVKVWGCSSDRDAATAEFNKYICRYEN